MLMARRLGCATSPMNSPESRPSLSIDITNRNDLNLVGNTGSLNGGPARSATPLPGKAKAGT